MSEGRYNIVPLGDSNFSTWKIQLKMVLIREDLWGFVTGAEVVPSTGSNSYRKQCGRRDKALSVIVMAIEPKLLYLIGADPEDPKEVYDKLCNTFMRKTWANKLRLRKQLFSLKLTSDISVHQHIKKFVDIFSELAILGDGIDEEDRVIYLLASLPDSYNTLVTALEAQEQVPSWEMVTEKLLNEEFKLKSKSNSTESHDALVSKTDNFKKTKLCYECGKPGHIKRNCYIYLRKQKELDAESKANIAQTNNSESCGLIVTANTVSENHTTDTWIMDSGATRHMCSDRGLFSQLLKLNSTIEIQVGDGRRLTAEGIGKVSINVKLPGNTVTTFQLINVLYVPKLAFNLISVSECSKLGLKFMFMCNSCEIFDDNNQLVAFANKKNELYYLDIDINNVNAVTVTSDNMSDLWHRRFCHLNKQSMDKLVNDKLVNGLDINSCKNLSFCEPCVMGKNHRTSFPSKSYSKTSQPLELIHSDVCGKVSTASFSGCYYFLTFIDDFTNFVWIYVLKTKNQVFDKFKEFKGIAEKQTGYDIKCLRSDNGGEYISNEFESFLRENGIKHQKTVPKSPEQNGKAERMNRTLVEAVRTMLSDAHLPKVFWAEALSTAVYLKNRSPTACLVGTTPFEALTGRKPDVGHLKIFGCIAYSHIPRDERQKLDTKSIKCVFLGYDTDTKGFRLYDICKKKVFISRDVVFNELENSASQKEYQNNKNVLSDKSGLNNMNLDDANVNNNEYMQINERPQRVRRPPIRFGESAFHVTNSLTEPETVDEALVSAESDLWKNAMQNEMDSMRENNVWELVELPLNKNLLKSKWVFKKKIGADGEIVKYKARLVAKGFSQKHLIDYNETFSPVSRFESIRAIMGLSVQNEMHIHQMDVSTAFLNGELNEEVYMTQPEGFVRKGEEQLVCKLNRSIYGLKQSPRCWNFALDKYIRDLGFIKAF